MFNIKGKKSKGGNCADIVSRGGTCINSRPLTHVSLDHNNDEALTPNHFLIGSSCGLITVGNYVKPNGCLRKQWKIAQQLADQFWRWWIKEYLPTLTRRTKWHRQAETLKVDNIVIIADNSMPRNYWPKGIVVKVYPGHDGEVHVAYIKTKRGIFKRSTAKMCVLDVREKG